MAVPITTLGVLRVLLQIQQNLTNLQRDMRNNATAWKSIALTQSLSISALAQMMNDTATAYGVRLSWLDTLQTDITNWNKVKSVYAALGGTAQEFTDQVTPMQQVVTQLGPATKTTYLQMSNICDQILAAIDSPLTLWPE